jgi:hypothetical protein
VHRLDREAAMPVQGGLLVAVHGVNPASSSRSAGSVAWETPRP